MFHARLIVAVTLVLALASLASARVTVNVLAGGGTYNVDAKGGDVYEVTLTATSTTVSTEFQILRSSANDIIEFIRIESSNPGKDTILDIGSEFSPLLEIKEISLLDDQGFTWINYLNVSTHLRNVQVNGILIANVGGNLMGSMLLQKHGDGGTFLGFLQLTGNVECDIELEDDGTSPFGRFGIAIINGSVGSEQSPVVIQTGGSLERIAAAEINATIKGTGSSGTSTYIPNLGAIESVGAIRGEIRGKLSGIVLESGVTEAHIRTEGDLEAAVYLGTSLEDTYELGNDIQVGEEGLKGPIVINAFDVGGDWTAPVIIDNSTPVTLIGNTYGNPNAYPNTAASLGGGSVGVVPFKRHYTDSIPAFVSTGETYVDPDTLGNEIVMRHYGPVIWNSGDGQPYKIERRKAGSSDSWVEQSCFTCTLDSNPTIVRITSSSATIQRGYQYRLTQLTRSGDGSNVLRCDLPHLTTTNDPEVFDYSPVTFTVCETTYAWAPGDADDSGLVDENDVDNVLNNWGSTACMKYGDADRNGVVNSVDLEVAETYLAWEYCYTGPGGFTKAADGFAQMDLDSDPAAMSAPMTVTEAVVAMGYDDIGDFGASFDAMSAPARAAARACLMALISGE